MSRKLAGAIAAMLSIVGIVLGGAVIEGIPNEVLLSAIGAISGLGGFQIIRQAHTDDLEVVKEAADDAGATSPTLQ